MPVLYKALSSASAFRGGAGPNRTGAAGPLPAGQMGPRRALLPLLLLLRESGPSPRSRCPPMPLGVVSHGRGLGSAGRGSLSPPGSQALAQITVPLRLPANATGEAALRQARCCGGAGMGLGRRSWSPAVEEEGYRCAGSWNGGTTGCACSLGKRRALALALGV